MSISGRGRIVDAQVRPNHAEPSVTLQQVGHRFGQRVMLFHDVNVTLQAGHVYALVGPSGSGKSTMLSILAGWTTPTEGEVLRHGVWRVNWDHVMLPYLAQGVTVECAERRARALLAEFGLERLADRQYRELSGGEAQRLMLARGVACNADLLLVDEPTAQLDIHTADTVNARLGALARRGTIVVVATHDHRTRDAATDVIDLEDYQ